MLSPHEYEQIHWQLNHISDSFNTQQRQRFRRALNKKLKEHKYASAYPPYRPRPYEIIFINCTTTERTLKRIANIINDSTIFTLDTEATLIAHHPNKPSIIQIQIVPSPQFLFILIIEVCYLPRTDQSLFTLIKQLFNSLFQPRNKFFIWGQIDELLPFIQYQLFTSNQIYLPRIINVQQKFNKYWIDNYPHRPTLNGLSICICKSCFGIQHDNSISLQDAVAFEFHLWLDKRLTCQPFDIGLDPHLHRLNDEQLEFRQSLCTYAANDCDAIHQLIISTHIINEQNDISSTITTTTNFLTNNSFRTPSELLPGEPISSDDEQPTFSINPTYTRVQLTDKQKKKIHNRSCTLRQRKRYYKQEIIYHDIDKRFSIRQIKMILRQYDISFYAVNTSISSLTNKRSLYIGIRDVSQIQTYERITRHLFNTHHYNKIRRLKHQLN